MAASTSVEQQVLAFLVDSGDEPLPAEIVAKKLGVPATETLRALEGLRARGYRIDARDRGWRLTGYPERLGENELEPLLPTRELGRSIRYFEETTSTSEIAWRIGEEGAPHGLVVIADRQTAGRGRMKRAWLSPGGCNIYLSVLLRPDVPPARSPELTLVAAVALCEAIRETGCERARIKWPNDVEIGGKKAAGILTEMCTDESGNLDFVVVGIGVDVNMTADQMPPELAGTATSVRLALGRPYPRARLLARLLDRLETWLDRYEDEGFQAVRARWTSLSSTVNVRVRVQLEGRAFEGRAEGIDEAGHLIVHADNGAVEHVVAGDVQLVRSDG